MFEYNCPSASRLNILTVFLLLAFGVTSVACEQRDAAPTLLLPFERATQWGFIDVNGRVRIRPQFESAERFSDGMALVRLDAEGYWGAIDANGSIAIPFEYAFLSTFQDGFAQARLPPDSEDAQQGIRRILKADGSVVFQTDWQLWQARDQGNLFTIIDISVTPRRFGILILGADGHSIRWLQFRGLSVFSDGLAPFLLDDTDLIGYCDTKGDIVIAPRFVNASPFKYGWAEVQEREHRWGLIDVGGNWILGPACMVVTPLNSELARVSCPDEWPSNEVIIDRQGNPLWEVPVSSLVDSYVGNGLLAASAPFRYGIDQERVFGYVNAFTGRWAISPRFSHAGHFDDGVAEVTWPSGRWGYINTRGRIIWRSEK